MSAFDFFTLHCAIQRNIKITAFYPYERCHFGGGRTPGTRMFNRPEDAHLDQKGHSRWTMQ